MPQDWTEHLYSTAVNFQHGVSLASDARVLPDKLKFLNLTCRARSRNVSFSQDYPLELAQQLMTNACIGEGYRLRPLDRLYPRCIL